MGSTKPSQTLTAKDILYKTNYYIEYNYVKDNHAQIKVTWLNNGIFDIVWTPENGSLYSNFHNSTLKVPNYCVPTFCKIWLYDISRGMKFPVNYLFYKSFNNRCRDLKFPIQLTNDETKLEDNFRMLVEDIEKNGLLPAHLEMIKDLEVREGFEIYMNYRYKVKLENVA